MKKTILERYSEMVKSKIRGINNIKALQKKNNSNELDLQMMNEIRSLNELLTNKYYYKMLDAERKELIKKYIKNKD